MRRKHIISLFAIFFLTFCQSYSDYHRGDISGRILDSSGSPAENVYILRSSLEVILQEMNIESIDSLTLIDTSYATTSDLYGHYNIKKTLTYFSSSEPNSFGCSSDEAHTIISNTLLWIVTENQDTTTVLLANPKTTDANWEVFESYVDTIIFLDRISFDYYKQPAIYNIPDIIIN